ncbi:hypothetical protein GLAREA_08480 [Glarea lozoyensis ATCC 20868]|uniref:Uncharacterized protein n=1 Tax=Glarea lozoyensis (strain ATCC 20868 / MF5171) TaxID=1116229 RepID=S3CDM8_GLAL2|nr:uncharacterized protein GLAREA_08480 [Glarea lozoyensis ATCC 20868]EPE24627.1 hypothetical protein GLAREA_08480 [Glarea lozoyensis ATCC 20868]
MTFKFMKDGDWKWPIKDCDTKAVFRSLIERRRHLMSKTLAGHNRSEEQALEFVPKSKSETTRSANREMNKKAEAAASHMARETSSHDVRATDKDSMTGSMSEEQPSAMSAISANIPKRSLLRNEKEERKKRQRTMIVIDSSDDEI